MEGRNLTASELKAIVPGAGVTLAAIMAIMAIAITAVVVYRMFKSKTGSAKIPGGWQFTWK